MKRVILSFCNGFCYSIAITMVIQMVQSQISGKPPMLPEYMARFDSVLSAFAFQLILIGIMSGITSVGTAIFELKRIGLVAQSIIFLLIMLAAWLPVACYVWGFHKYVISMVSTLCSIVVTYGVCWGIMYRYYRKEIEEINDMLKEGRD